MGYIKGQFDKICSKAITRFARKFESKIEEVQLILFLKFDKEMTGADVLDAVMAGSIDLSAHSHFTTGYLVLDNFEVKEEITAKELIDRKLDFMNKAYLVSEKIREVLIELCSTEKILPDQMRIMIFMHKDEVRGALYNGMIWTKNLNLNEVLDDLKMLNSEQG